MRRGRPGCRHGRLPRWPLAVPQHAAVRALDGTTQAAGPVIPSSLREGPGATFQPGIDACTVFVRGFGTAVSIDGREPPA